MFDVYVSLFFSLFILSATQAPIIPEPETSVESPITTKLLLKRHALPLSPLRSHLDSHQLRNARTGITKAMLFAGATMIILVMIGGMIGVAVHCLKNKQHR
jgi:hypothetical protein